MVHKRASIILAAGKSSRMNSSLSKVLHCVGGQSMLAWSASLARAANVSRAICVVGSDNDDVKEAAKVYQQALGVDSVEFETVETEGVKVAIIELENGRIELMQPTNDSSPIKKFLDKKGQGLHHMALDLSLIHI